jgi:hypothetical protein
MILVENRAAVETCRQNSELNRESLQVTAAAFLALIGMAALGAVAIAALPNGPKST